MFTGIIETIGAIVERRVSSKDSIVLTIEARDIARQLRIGDSISINGLCQTVISCDETSFKTQAVGPTLDKTTVRGWQVNDRVNLERSMVMGKRLDGHIVQGHVDGIGTIARLKRRGKGQIAVIEVPEDLTHYIVREGSCALDGVSLTVAAIDERLATFSLIPHTCLHTILIDWKEGGKVNVEVDIIGRYVAKLLRRSGTRHND